MSAQCNKTTTTPTHLQTGRNLIVYTDSIVFYALIDRGKSFKSSLYPLLSLHTVTQCFLFCFLSSLTSLTSGMKPFSPRSPGDINLEDVVKFSRAGGKLSQGVVKFVGHLPGRNDAYLGVELDKAGGCSCSNGNN